MQRGMDRIRALRCEMWMAHLVVLVEKIRSNTSFLGEICEIELHQQNRESPE